MPLVRYEILKYKQVQMYFEMDKFVLLIDVIQFGCFHIKFLIDPIFIANQFFRAF